MHFKKIGILLTLLVSVIHGLPVEAQEFPNKPIRMVVGFPPGGGIDQLARLLADGMSSQLGQNIIVDKVFKYEDGIEDQINYILPEHNLPKIKINTFEKNFTPKKIKYYDVFSKNQINKIYEEWEWEFDTFGYFK